MSASNAQDPAAAILEAKELKKEFVSAAAASAYARSMA